MGLIARDVSLSVCVSLPFSLVSCFIAAVHFHPLVLSVPPPSCLSVILTFTLCLSVPVSLSPPLYFPLSSWLCFSAEVSADSSHIFLPALFLFSRLVLPAPRRPILCSLAWTKSDDTSLPKRRFSQGHSTLPETFFLTAVLSSWCCHYLGPFSGQQGMTHFTHTTPLNGWKYVWAAG